MSLDLMRIPFLKTYSFRPHYFDTLKTLSLEDRGLVIESEQQPPITLAYSDITGIHLGYTRGKHTVSFHCTVTPRMGKPFRIKHKHFVGFADMKDQSELYTPFVLSLHRKLIPFQSQLRFQSGSWLSFLALLILLPLALALVVTGALIQQWVALLVGVVLIWQLVRALPRARPRDYTPDSPPVLMLPGLEKMLEPGA